jgi:channel protein (hemolysin III family)
MLGTDSQNGYWLTLLVLGCCLTVSAMELKGQCLNRWVAFVFTLVVTASAGLIFEALRAGLPTADFLLLAVGIIFCLVGAVFYWKKDKPFNHFFWHLLTALGAGIHALAVARL